MVSVKVPAARRAAGVMQRETVQSSKTSVRVVQVLAMFAAESPIPDARTIAGRLGVSTATVFRILGSAEFLRGLDEMLSTELTRLVKEGIAVHVDTMRDASATRAERMSAARWLHGRWSACRKAVAVGHDEPEAAVAQNEAKLLEQVIRETQAWSGHLGVHGESQDVENSA